MTFPNKFINENRIQYDWLAEEGRWKKTDLWREAERKEATRAKELVGEFKSEAESKNPTWVKGARIKYLQNQIKSLASEIVAILKDYRKIKDYKNIHFSKDSKLNEGIARSFLKLTGFGEKEKLMKRYSHELRYLKFSNGAKKRKITEQMIQQARDYPFENLVEVNKNKFALCPFHDDHTPSLYTKGNYGHCFSGGCGWSGDTIKFVMDRDKISFVEAVKKLCR